MKREKIQRAKDYAAVKEIDEKIKRKVLVKNWNGYSIGNHHPYCLETYAQSRENHMSWSCRCDLLKAYDQWRRETCTPT